MSSDESSSHDGMVTNLRRKNTAWRSARLQKLFEELWDLHTTLAHALNLRPKEAQGITLHLVPCGLPPLCYSPSYLQKLDDSACSRLLTTHRIRSLPLIASEDKWSVV